MSQISETADLEEQIAALIEQAGDSLRQRDDTGDARHQGGIGATPVQGHAAPPLQPAPAVAARRRR